MITGVDSSVLLDVFLADPVHGPTSAHALRRCMREGRIVACDVVFAEVSAAFADSSVALEQFARLGLGFEPVAQAGAIRAGRFWRAYREAGGKRERVIADFLIAAHAAEQCDRLLARDRGFAGQYFADLTVLDPSR